MAYKRMACQLKIGEHIILPHSAGEDIGLIKAVEPDKYGQYYDITFDNITTKEENVTFHYEGTTEVITEEELKYEWPFELVETSEESLNEFKELISHNGLNIESEGKTLLSSNHHFQVRAKLPQAFDSEEKAKEALIKFVEPFKHAVHEWEKENNTPVTFSFGIDEKGEVTAGIDVYKKAKIKLPERIKKASLDEQLKTASNEVNAQSEKSREREEQER